MKKSPKALFFDLDGTLVDSMEFYVEAWRTALGPHQIPVDPKVIYEREGEKGQDTAHHLFSTHKNLEPDAALLDEVVLERERAYAELFQLRFLPNATELVQKLSEQHMLGIVTGSTRLPQALEDRSDFVDCFEFVVTSLDVAQGKPAPDSYLMALANSKLLKEECLVVENAPLGIRAAKAAGIPCLAVLGGSPLSRDVLYEAGADEVFGDLFELEKFLQGMKDHEE